jgi:ABC-type branched-subunit amino acid transport system substrate-binding protein
VLAAVIAGGAPNFVSGIAGALGDGGGATTVKIIAHWLTIRRRSAAAFCALLTVALAATACGEPQVPVARSSSAELVTATSEPAPPTPTPLPAPTAEPTPGSGEPVPTPRRIAQPGLSNDVIRVAVIFDDETQGTADELFRDGWLGTLAWANEVNDDGGLGGRFVEVVPIDSLLFDHQSALEQVCQGDFFAIVGSHSLGDAEGAELLGTEQCNIADFPGQVYGSRRAASPVTVLSNPFLNDIRQAGPASYLAETFPKASQNLGLLRYFALDLERANERQREMLIGQGLDVVFELPAELEEDPAERIVSRWEASGAESLVWVADPGRLISLLDALEEPPSFVLCEWGCYSQQFLLDGGEAVEGVYTWIAHSHFDSPNARGDLFQYRANLATVAPDAGWSEIGLQSWMAGRLFEEAFNRLLQVEPELPTREQLIQIARGVDLYAANGILSATNPGGGEPTPCFVLMVVRNGRWEQEYPEPPRDQDCAEKNLHELVTSRSLGITTLSATTSDAQPTPEAEPDLENPEELEE